MKRINLPKTMRALVLSAYGDTEETLRLEECPIPRLDKGDVLVQMTAAPINPSDVLFINGRYGVRKPLPVVPGLEGSGTIVATGKSWRARSLLGSRVSCGTPEDSDGTWAEYMRTQADRCFPLSPQVSNARGSMMIVNPLTAWGLVDTMRQRGHQAGVQTAAASSLGQMIARLAKRFRFPMVHVVRRSEQVATLHALGAEHVLNSNAPEFEQQLAQLCRQLNATALVDAVGGELTAQLLHAMPHGSQALVYGALAGENCQVSALDLIFAQTRVEGFWLTDWIRTQNLPTLIRTSMQVQRLLSSDLRSGVQACLPLEEAQFALKLYQERMSAGKVLLVPALRRM